MNPLVRHLRIFLRYWLLAVGAGIVFATLVATAIDPQAGLEVLLESTGFHLLLFWSGLLLFGTTLALIARSLYHRSATTIPAGEILKRIATSDDEYCLILRPFGHDGATVVSRWPRIALYSPTLTLEQVVAQSIQRNFGMKTYALVDQDKKLAPPGPVYLRAPHTEWRHVARVMISRAHTILLILPPAQEDQEIREAFAWELQQITQWDLQSRVVAVLPPRDRRGDNRAHGAARRQACLILATLEGFAGAVDEVDQLKIDHYDRILPRTTLLVKADRTGPGGNHGVGNALCWSVPDGRKKPSFATYSGAVAEAVSRNNTR